MEPQDIHDSEPLLSKQDADEMMKDFDNLIRAAFDGPQPHYAFVFAAQRFGNRGPNGEAMFNIVSHMDGCARCGLVGMAKMLASSLSSGQIAFFMERIVEEVEKLQPIHQKTNGMVN